MSLLVHRFADHLSHLSSPRPWGFLEVTSPVRYGWRGWRLTVFPPGTSPDERRLLWLDRHVGYLAALMVLPLMLAVQPAVPPMALLLFIPLAAMAIALVRHRASGLRARVRILSVAYVDVDGATRVLGDGELVDQSVAALEELDRARMSREITPAQYELGWAGVYDAVSRGVSVHSR
jgi:hypothetical protein